jgi:hypothetical protein
MKKLKLSVDTLKVDSFRPTQTEAVRGTVQGNEPTHYGSCYCYTIDMTCPNTCQYVESCQLFC